MKFTGVSGVISAAHYSREGSLHGHTWQIVVWFKTEDRVKNAEPIKDKVLKYLEAYDHRVLADALAWGEDLAERIGLDLNAYSVDVSRPLEGYYAKWVRD